MARGSSMKDTVWSEERENKGNVMSGTAGETSQALWSTACLPLGSKNLLICENQCVVGMQKSQPNPETAREWSFQGL